MSIRTRSGLRSSAFLSASEPSCASPTTWNPCSCSKSLANPFLKSAWSSTSNSRIGCIVSLFNFNKRYVNDDLCPFAGSALNGKLPTYALDSLSHSLKAEMEYFSLCLHRDKTVPIVRNSHLREIPIPLEIEHALRSPRMFKSVSQSLVDNADQLNLFARGKPDSFWRLDLEIDRDFPNLAEVMKVLGESGDKAKAPGDHSSQAEDGLPHILVSPVRDLTHLP